MAELTKADLFVLSLVRDDDAYWTSDIAYGVRRATPVVRRALERLSVAGLVEKVVVGGKGLPSSWRRLPAGRIALEKSK